MASAFDKIAKKATDAPKDKTVKIAATVNEDIQVKVDSFVAAKAEIKRLEAEQKTLEEAIISHIRPQQDELAFSGTFTKSLEVAGKTTRVLYSTMDRFSVPQDESAQAAIKNCVGKKYTDMFDVKRTIGMQEPALKNEPLLNKIFEVCEKANLDVGSIFEVTDKIIAKDDLDRKQYELTKKQLDVFRTLVRQSKPALK